MDWNEINEKVKATYLKWWKELGWQINDPTNYFKNAEINNGRKQR